MEKGTYSILNFKLYYIIQGQKMAYLKKRYREIIERIDKELKLPKGWSYFVKKEDKKIIL